MSQQGGLVAELVNEMGINGQMANQMQMVQAMQGQGSPCKDKWVVQECKDK